MHKKTRSAQSMDLRFGRGVRRARTHAGISMQDLAAEVGCSAPAISNIEHGRGVSLYLAAVIAQELGRNLDDLVWGS